MGCGEIRLGKRVKHRMKGYEGWIVGCTDDRQLFDGHKTNSDKKTQWRIYTHLGHIYRHAAEEDLEVCNDLEEALDRTKLNEADRIFIGSEDFSQLPIRCWIWTLGPYHARSMLKSVRGSVSASGATHTSRIQELKGEMDDDAWIL